MEVAGVEYAGFKSEAEARAWRAGRGGWVFVADTGEAIWFALPMTPTPIMLHPVTRGKSGKLI